MAGKRNKALPEFRPGDFTVALAAGGKTRYEAILALGEFDKAGANVSALKSQLTECLFDPELGTYRRAYWLFSSFVARGVDLTAELPKLVERAQDYYHGGQELRTILCRYAELSLDHARAVLRAGQEQGIPFEDYEEPYPSDVDYTASGNDRLWDELSGPREIVKAPEWFRQIYFLTQATVKPRVQPQTLRWDKYGVTIGGGKLNWFEDGGGSYSQTYTEFRGQPRQYLWIDRTIPENLRIDLYRALGGQPPPETSVEERIQEFKDFMNRWKSTGKTLPGECPTCSKIPDSSSRGENNSEGRWDNIPPERYALKSLMTNLHRSEILGCGKCRQLYEISTYHDNIMGQQEDSETLSRIEAAELEKLWLKDIAAGERITYLRAGA